MRKYLLTLLVISLMLYGCGQTAKQTGSETPVPTGTVSGYLINSFSSPVSGATLTLTIDNLQSSSLKAMSKRVSIASMIANNLQLSSVVATVTSNPDGSFSFDNVPAGTYRLTATYNDLAGTKSNIQVSSGQVANTGTLILKNTGELYGIIDIASTANNSMAIVVLLGTNQVAYTNSSGEYRMTNVPAGTYDLAVTKLGYIDVLTTNIIVTVNATTTLNQITLAQDPNYQTNPEKTGWVYIDKDITWTTANSPYVIDRYITVKSGATLTIEAGVEVRFYNGISGLVINGNLIANTTSDNRVTFTGYPTENYRYNNYSSAGLMLNNLTGSALQHMDFYYIPVNFYRDSSSIENCRFTNSRLTMIGMNNYITKCAFTFDDNYNGYSYVQISGSNSILCSDFNNTELEVTGTGNIMNCNFNGSRSDNYSNIISEQDADTISTNIVISYCNIENSNSYCIYSYNGKGSISNSYIANNNKKTGATMSTSWSTGSDSSNPQWQLNSKWTISNPTSNRIAVNGRAVEIN